MNNKRIRGRSKHVVMLDDSHDSTLAILKEAMIMVDSHKPKRSVPPPFSQADTVTARYYFVAAWRHVRHILPEPLGVNVLRLAEKDIWGEAKEETVANAEAIVMAEVIVGMGITPVPGLIREQVLRAVEQQSAAERVERRILLGVLSCLHGHHYDIATPRMQDNSAWMLGGWLHQQGDKDWRKAVRKEINWLTKLRADMWPPLGLYYPGMIDRTTYELARSLARGGDHAYALADALEEGPHAGDGVFVKRAIRHFRKTTHHPLGCKYLTRLLDPSNLTSEPRRPMTVMTGLGSTLKPQPANYYVGWTVTIVSGRGAGQTRTVIASDTSNPPQLTLSSAWAIPPDSTSTFAFQPSELTVCPVTYELVDNKGNRVGWSTDFDPPVTVEDGDTLTVTETLSLTPEDGGNHGTDAGSHE